MKGKNNRVGEENINNFGSKIIIKEYRSCMDMDVYFPEYNWTAKSVKYQNFKKGQIKCPYERRTYGVGYIGEGKYKTRINGKKTKCYDTWQSMLQRCYDNKYHEKYPTYINCEVCDEWLNYQNFGTWYEGNYYEVKDEVMCLDKDILDKGNKIYSPENCVFVPENINKLFIKCDRSRGEYPLGVIYHKHAKKFMAQYNIYDLETNKSKHKHLGYYDTPEQAFQTYKQFKEKNITKDLPIFNEKINRLR